MIIKGISVSIIIERNLSYFADAIRTKLDIENKVLVTENINKRALKAN